MIKNRKAAMELTMGTMVTIVLLVAVLILGLYFVNQIFSSASTTLDEIDQSVKSEISKIFAEDATKKVVIYPETRLKEIKKGEYGQGFGFSIRNIKTDSDKFSYSIDAIETSCPESLRLADADKLITLGKEGNNIIIPAGSIMGDPIFVRFDIPESTPPCEIRYDLNVEDSSGAYISSVGIDLKILSR